MGRLASSREAAPFETVLLAYAALWAEADAGRRQALLDQCLSNDARIIGPGFRLAGHAAISQEVERFLRHERGVRAVLASGYALHSGWARFGVAMVDATGAVVAEGEDVVELGADGRIATVVTFWGAVPEVPAQWPDELVVPRAASRA
jgi:hypothetical protein